MEIGKLKIGKVENSVTQNSKSGKRSKRTYGFRLSVELRPKRESLNV